MDLRIIYCKNTLFYRNIKVKGKYLAKYDLI